MASDYHGVKPVTEDDKELAEKHLKETQKLREKQHDLVQDKIDDHRKALKKRVKDGEKRSAAYNKSHMEKHQDELDDIDHEQDKLHKSLQTLSQLRTHSRKTYNAVQNARVQLKYRKQGK